MFTIQKDEITLLTEAMQLLKQNHLDESQTRFQEAIALHGPQEAEGYYGLGQIALLKYQRDVAITHFQRALKLKPDLPGPAHSLAQLAPAGVYGLFEFLRNDPAPQAKEALILLHQLLRVHNIHPPLSAYLFQLRGFLLAALITLSNLVITLLWWQSGPRTGLIAYDGVVLLVCLPALIHGLPRCLRIYTTRYTIRQARIFVTTGILRKHTVTHNLHHVHNIELEQSFLNRLTSNATFVLHLDTGKGEVHKIRITGLAHGRELQGFHAKLVNLTTILRTFDIIKGFIQP